MGCQGSFLMPERLAEEGIEALEDFCHKMDLPTGMQEPGIDDSQFAYMAKNVRITRMGTAGHLEKLNWQDVLHIYRIAAGQE
jgi:alcohol dehydrogenase YqhD (iron-dependent ADH family)